MEFDRKTYFDMVRPLFGGTMNQGQVEGQEAILTAWEIEPRSEDLRWLAYSLATAMHETGSTMAPCEEIGRGEGQPYGNIDPETGQGYWGRGYIQLTWRDNYARADKELGLFDELSCEWHAGNALKPGIAAEIMFQGMVEGWFRGDEDGRHTLERYFNGDIDEPYQAREIINGDKHIVPDWSDGVPIGNLIADYHDVFLTALQASVIEAEP